MSVKQPFPGTRLDDLRIPITDGRRSFETTSPCTASIDFLVVPTLTFKILFVLVILSHDRRKVVHFGVTPNPTAEWTAQQITEAFPWDEAPRFLIRDRHRTYGQAFRDRVTAMGIMEVPTAPRSAESSQ